MPAKHTTRVTAAAVAAAVMALGLIAGESPAAAQTTCGSASTTTPALTVSPQVLPAQGTSTVTVSGSRYMVPPHPAGADVFGGVYVFFGWVAPGGQWGPGWRGRVPSNPFAGLFGATYAYPGEDAGAQTRDDGSGTVRLVSFTPGGLSGSETAYHMDCDGSWQTTITVRGATFQWRDSASGASSTIDCRTVQCGVLTIGAHGKASQTNEVFTPITFAVPPTQSGGGTQSPPPGGTATPGGGAQPAPSDHRSGGAGGARPGGTPTTPNRPTADPTTTTTTTTVPATTTTTGLEQVATTTTPRAPTTSRHPTDREHAAAVVEDGDDGPGAGLVLAGAGAAAAAALAGGLVLQRRRAPNRTIDEEREP